MRILILSTIACFVVIPFTAFGYSIEEAEENLRDLQFEQVLEQLKPNQIPEKDNQAYAYYLLGMAAFHLEQYEKAMSFFDTIYTDYQDSRWFVKAAYRKAECLMQLKRFPLAEAIYATGAQGLMSEKRRNEIADIYIHHADDFFAPKKKDKTPSFERARTLYEYAKEILPKSPRWERVSFQIGMTFFKQEQWEESQKNLQDLIAFYESNESSPSSADESIVSASAPNPYPTGGYLDDAMLYRGEALFRLNQKEEARKIWRKMRDQRKNQSKRPDIIAEASYRIAKTYGIPQPNNDKELALGVRSLEEYLQLFPDHEHTADAALQKAEAYFHRRQYTKALEGFREFLRLYEEKADPEQSASAEMYIARCQVQQEKYEDAIQSFKEFLIHHPVDKNWSEAQHSIIDTKYRKIMNLQRQAERELQRWKRKLQEENRKPEPETIPAPVVQTFESVEKEIELFQKDYPLDGRISSLLLQIGKNERALQNYSEAISIWKDIASRYPNSDPASEALYLIAVCTEQDLGELDKSIELYQEVTFGSHQREAQERIRLLQSVHLAIRTERTFHTNESPAIKVNTRNIENYTCKLYPLDLKAYFETRHTIRNIEDLDVNLISAEKVWDVTPEDYSEYKLIEQNIPIPVEGPGAWVVQVESETLEGVTLVLVSDLAIAIQGGKKEIFVYAEDQRRELPMSDTEILVNDGKSIIAQGKTNGDGIFHLADLNAIQTNRLSVFAVANGNCAGEELRIENLSAATNLQPRVVVYTDRPAYQPGDRMHYRALIREIEDGKYTIPQEHEFEASVFDNRGVLIHQKKSKLSEFGTMHGELLLDPFAPHGQYRVEISRKDGPSGAWTFEVQEFTLPTARIEIETKQTTYFYGDKISGTIKVGDYSGNPFANEKVTYFLASEWQEGTTDDEGKIEFEFETWDLPEEGMIQIIANLPHRQVQGQKNLILVSTGFSITLETTRDTYLAGEPFQVQITARSRDDERTLLAQPLKISLNRRNDEGVYEEVQTETITTSDDERQKKSVPFTAQKGGSYRIEAEGTDSRGTVVTSRKTLHISGEDDTNKLLVLSDQSNYEQGETASFTLFSRLPENLVLMTGVREGIVEYRIETLKPGKNRIEWQLDDRYSPTCIISFLVMHENEVHQAETVFNVNRGLDVTITANEDKYGPRDEAEILVETRDHTGKAVSAELSLGLIDKALLALFSDRLGNLKQYFDQSARGRFLNTASSADFSYDGITKKISEDILRERLLDIEEGELALQIMDDAGLRRGGEIRKAKQVRSDLQLAPAARPPSEPEAPVAREEMARGAIVLDAVSNRYRYAETVNGRFRQRAGDAIGQELSELQSRGFAGRTMAGISAATYDRPQAGNYFFSLSDLDHNGLYAGYGMGMMGGTLALGQSITRSYFPETAYFNPSVITDEEGKAVVHVSLPDSLTTWEAQARAITKDTLVDQGKQDIVVDKPFRVDWEAPHYLTEGDKSSGIASIRNNTGKRQTGKLNFTQTIDDRDQHKEWDIEIDSGEVYKQFIPLTTDNVQDSTVTIGATAEDMQDQLEKSLPVVSWGIPVRAGASGISGQSEVHELSLPSQVDYSRLHMWITLGGVGDISMLSPAWSGRIHSFSTHGVIEQGLAALAALDCAESLQQTDRIPVETLRSQIEAAVRHAVASQSDDGLWAWSGGRNSQADIMTTGRVTELLQRAKGRGYTVPQQILERAVARLDTLYQQSTEETEKIHILYAWSTIAPANFAYVNRVHRDLSRLDPFDAALLGLTWLNMERNEKAQEVMNDLLNRNTLFINVHEKNRHYFNGNINNAAVVAARLYFSLPASVRSDAHTKSFLDSLSSDPICLFVVPGTPIGWRVQALAAYLQSAAEEQHSFELVVNVNGKEIVRKRTSRSALPHERINIDPEIVKSSDNRVEFGFEGRGNYQYSAVLEGWTKQDVRPQEWLKPESVLFTQVEREYEHGPLMYKNQEIPRGYGVVSGSYESVKNKLEEVPAGNRVNVNIKLYSPQQRDYLVVQDRLPAGFVLVKNSINGPVDHHVQVGNTLTLYLRGPRQHFYIRYQLQSVFPGTYRVPPAIITATEKPEQIYATTSKELIILEEGKSPKESYHPTPDELYHLGLRHFEDNHYEEAEKYLSELMNTYSLDPEPYLETARKLFRIYLQLENAQELVRYFEIIKERDRNFDVTFEQIATLARAYRNICEHERAVYVFRSLMEGLFKQEGAVSGTLQEVGQYREALDYAKQLILEYPDIPTVQTAVYTTGSVIYSKIDEWAQNPDFIQSGNDKKALLAEAVGMIQSFLTLYPNNPIADEAGYTLINLWLDQQNYEKVNQLTTAFAKRYPQSTYLDSYDFLRAYALFQLEQYTQALQQAEKVSTEEYPAPGGAVQRSEEADNAVHMAGKILHASGELDRALEQYERVKESFGDAAESIEYLTNKGLEVDEVSIFRKQEPATITIRHKNLEQAEMSVYQVDLMSFYLSERDLNRMTNINLAGITPVIEKTLSFKNTRHRDWNEETVELPLQEQGAYLIVLRGNGVSDSGMVLRSDLELEVQEDPARGTVRVNVKKGSPPAFAKDVKVQVRGSENDRFVTGTTDLRGVFSASGIQGVATVLAQLNDQYGFYRGTVHHGQAEKFGRDKKAQAKESAGKAIQQIEELDALGSNYDRLNRLQERQLERWNEQTDPTNNRLRSQKAYSLY